MLQPWTVCVIVIVLPVLTAAQNFCMNLEDGPGFVEDMENNEVFQISFEQHSTNSIVGKFNRKSTNTSISIKPIPTTPLPMTTKMSQVTVFFCKNYNIRIFYVSENSPNDFTVGYIYANNYRMSSAFLTRFYDYTTEHGGKTIGRFSNSVRGNVSFSLRPVNLRQPYALFYKDFYDYSDPRKCTISALLLEQNASDSPTRETPVTLQHVKTRWGDHHIGRVWAQEDNKKIFIFTEIYPGVVCVQRSEILREDHFYGTLAFEVNPVPIATRDKFEFGQSGDITFEENGWPRRQYTPTNVPENIWNQLCREDRILNAAGQISSFGHLLTMSLITASIVLVQ